MNVGIGTVATQFLSWEYLFRIVGIVSMQCVTNSSPKSSYMHLHRIPFDFFIYFLQNALYVPA
jgi:hypothetical protein